MNFNEKLLAEAKELEKLWEIRSTDSWLYNLYPISLESERLTNEKKKRSKKEKKE